jgi:hypothetical protein
MSYGEGRPSFSDEFDQEFAIGHERNKAFFGRDVLRGLVDGIDDFIELREPRWRQFRSLGPALLGSAIWIDDEDLIERLEAMTAACIVVTKQDRRARKLEKLARLRELCERTSGMPIRAFPALGGLAPKVDGTPALVGPSSPFDDFVVPTIRTLGFRKQGWNVPIVHAKLALLGHLWWHDEGPLGHVEDVIGFTPRRLWISSANFTRSSRSSLEFGYWTEESELIEGAERFLVNLMRFSEDLDPEADSPDAVLAPVDFDDAAMAEAAAQYLDDLEDLEDSD